MVDHRADDQPVAGELSPVDLALLRELRSTARMPVSVLAERAGTSRSNVYARLEQLESRRVVLGYHAQVDPRRMGLGATAVVMAKVAPHGWPEFRAALVDIPEIEYACVTTGGWDAVIFVRSTDLPAIHVLVSGVIANLPSVTDVLTHLTVDELVRRPFVLPDELPDREEERERLGMGEPVRTADPIRRKSS